MLSKIIFSNENFTKLVSENMINKWNDFELVRKNFDKSKKGITRSLKQFNTYFSNEINRELSKIDSKIIFSKLDYSVKHSKNKFKTLCDYLKINRFKNEDYKCEFCEVPRFKLEWCHIIKRGMSNKKFDRCVLNYLFMCSNCHNDTEKPYRNEIKNRKFYKNQMRKLINKRKKVNKQLLTFLKSDINKYKKGIKLIENIKKEIENYKKEKKIFNDNFIKKGNVLINKIEQDKSEVFREIEKSIGGIREKYNIGVNKIRRRYKNLKIINKKVTKIKRQRDKDIDKKQKIKTLKQKKLDRIKKQKVDQLKEKGHRLSSNLYEKFKDKIRKIIKKI